MKIIRPTEAQLKEESQKSKWHLSTKKCKLCGSEFDYGQNTKTMCGLCKIELECPNCNEHFIVEWYQLSGDARKQIKEYLISGKEPRLFCSQGCASKMAIKKNPDKYFHKEFCNKCNRESIHIGDKCMICKGCFKSEPFLKNAIETGRRNLKDSSKKGLETQKRYWLIYNSNDIDDEDYLKAKEFCENKKENLNKILYERDDSGRIIKVNNISWEEYIKDYIINGSFDFNNEKFNRINFHESEIRLGHPTLSWEQRLSDVCECNKNWIVYIKYYKDKENNSKPLVVGKTGNNLVNLTGTDVVFDYDSNKENKRPARQFLEENNLKWDKSFIDFRCFETEQEAFDFEKYIKEKYNLLYG